MTFQGILDQSLGGFLCLRGFAPLGDLYDASAYDPGYQRTLIDEHGAEIARFYNDREYLFFPEIVLGVSVQATPGDETEMQLFYQYVRANDSANRKFRLSWCTISIKNLTAPSPADRRVTLLTRVVTITLKDLPPNTAKLLSRIDGNHRLSAVEYNNADEGIDGVVFRTLNAPFCLMLFRDATDNAQHSRVIFHNINYKSVPLDKEDNLKLILDDEQSLYLDEVLKTNPSFGLPFYAARKLNSRLHLNHLGGLTNGFTKQFSNGDLRSVKRTALLTLCQLLADKGLLTDTDEFLNKLVETIQTVNVLYHQYTALQASHSQAVLLLLIFYKLDAPYRCETFKRWVLTNHIYLSDDVETTQLLGVFESILNSKKHEIFVSMQFSPDTKPHYDAIVEAAQTVSQRHNIALNVTRIDHLNEGCAYQIPTKILELLNTSGLLIADLTHGNKNVYHEIGYLMGLNKAKGLEQHNFIFFLRNNQPANGDTDKEVGFNLRDWQQIRFDENGVLGLRDKLIAGITAY